MRLEVLTKFWESVKKVLTKFLQEGKAMTTKNFYAFGAFRLDPQQKILLREGERIPLHPKTYATLLALLETGGEVISKDDLMERVWPGTFVEESNLSKNVSLLRKALSNGHDHSDYIETIPTIGYRFVEPVQHKAGGDAAMERNGDVVMPVEKEKLVVPAPSHRLWLWSGFALLLLVGTSLVWFKWTRHQSTLIPAGASVAVMPFLNLTGETEQDYFSDGLTDHLIADLSRLKDFKVIARGSIFRYKGKSVDWREAGQQLNVAAILEGSINRVNDRLQINVRLRSTQDGRFLWSSEYNKALAEVLAIEKEIGCSVAANMQVVLCNDESSKLQTNNLDAYLAYLKGLYQFNLRTSESLKKAIKHFEQAVALDPNFAEGWASLADAYFLGKWYIPLTHEVVSKKGSVAAKKSWELDQASAHACLVLCQYLNDEGWTAESAELSNKIEILNPNYARFFHSAAIYQSLLGRYEKGIEMMIKTQELDPLSLVVNTDVGYAYYIARRYDEAIAAYRKAIAMDAKFSLAHLLLGLALSKQGHHQEAITEVQQAQDRGSEYLSALGYIYARAGKQQEAQATLQQLQQLARKQYVPSYQLAWPHIALGDFDQAIVLMRESVQKNAGVIDFKHHPIYEPLLADARYQELLRKAHFPW